MADGTIRPSRRSSKGARAITAGALVFAIGGVLLIAQLFDQQRGGVPGAEQPAERMEPSFFTGNIGASGSSISEASHAVRDDGVVIVTGEGYGGIEFITNDPRITGKLSMLKNEADYREGALADSPTSEVGTIRSGLFRIVNDDDAWEGPVTNLQLQNLERELDEGWLTGERDDEGLMAYVVIENLGAIRGHITPDGPPPVPTEMPTP
jgi:hypothetical protein